MKRYAAGLVLFLLPALACGYIPRHYWAITVKEARSHGIPPEMLGALIWVESRYCPRAQGEAGEIGLGQIMPGTARLLGYEPTHLWKPDLNIRAAAQYLSIQYRRFGNWKLALAAYNAGPARAYNPPTSTQQYVVNVLAVYRHLLSLRNAGTSR